MTLQILHALGGLGLFLVGLLVLTEGLRRFAGDAVHRALFRFTKSPTTGALTGAGLTAVLQSSSVTTVATVGFVSAGVLAFPQALGILLGANVGTTITGWMVALLGFEFDVERLVHPLLIGGVLLHLFGRRQLAHLGWAVAGFAILFLGLDAMQAAMAEFQGAVTPSDFPDDTAWGRVLLIGIGIVVTLVTQSSSAGVATALTAVDAGAISFAQGAALVIGMDVGTTSTTALATIGGSASTKRTGYAHVVYNLLTGVAAYLLLDPYVWAVDQLVPGGAASNAPMALVGFHTTFNLLGLVAVLPFAGAFARMMTRLVPEPGGRSDPAERLDPKLLADPTAASLTLLGAVREMSAELMHAVAQSLDPARDPVVDTELMAHLDRSVDAARRYADRIDIADPRPDARRFLLAGLHVIDHLDRLVDRCRDHVSIAALREDEQLRPLAADLHAALVRAVAALRDDVSDAGEPDLRAANDRIRAERQPYRERVLATVPEPEVLLDQALVRLDAIRWLHRTAHHAWRISRNLGEAAVSQGPPATEHPARAEVASDGED